MGFDGSTDGGFDSRPAPPKQEVTKNMTHIRVGKAERIDGAPAFLQVIWTANDIRPGTFTAPTINAKWWAGGTAEEYPDARVIHRLDDSISIVSKTPDGDWVLHQAAATLGIVASNT